MFGLTPTQTLFAIGLLVLPILPNILAIWHVFPREFPTPQEKMAWLALAVFLPVIGGLVYWIMGRKRGKVAS